jgi:hypothetical protein
VTQVCFPQIGSHDHAPRTAPHVTGAAGLGGTRSTLLAGLVADLLGEDDVAVLLDRVVAAAGTLEITASSISLVDTDPADMRIMAASDERAEHLVRHEVRLGTGPSLDGDRDPRPDDPEPVDLDRWPDYRAEAESLGIRSAIALSLDAADRHIGAMVLYGTDDLRLGRDDGAFARALADIAVLAILRSRTTYLQGTALDLSQALADQTAVEQASGMVAEIRSCTVRDGMHLLRTRAVAGGLPLATLARAVIDRDEDPTTWDDRP